MITSSPSEMGTESVLPSQLLLPALGPPGSSGMSSPGCHWNRVDFWDAWETGSVAFPPLSSFGSSLSHSSFSAVSYRGSQLHQLRSYSLAAIS